MYAGCYRLDSEIDWYCDDMCMPGYWAGSPLCSVLLIALSGAEFFSLVIGVDTSESVSEL